MANFLAPDSSHLTKKHLDMTLSRSPEFPGSDTVNCVSETLAGEPGTSAQSTMLPESPVSPGAPGEPSSPSTPSTPGGPWLPTAVTLMRSPSTDTLGIAEPWMTLVAPETPTETIEEGLTTTTFSVIL